VNLFKYRNTAIHIPHSQGINFTEAQEFSKPKPRGSI
jgi:hypothetical protein